MHLIVGLGNPGSKYALTRHNIGFMLVDALATAYSFPQFKTEHKALVSKAQIEGKPVLLVKPQTFMNLSGESVQPLMSYYNVELNHLLVAHDEVDLPFNSLRFQKSRGHGGHNGIRSVHQLLGTKDYTRLKLGVGRPSHPGHEVADYVLAAFSKDEMTSLPDFLNRSIDGVETFVTKGYDQAANLYNGKKDS